MRDCMDEEIWEYSDIEISDETGHVKGSAYTREKDGYSVQLSVNSYKFGRGAESRTNHVPNVVITDESGYIVAEPNAADSTNCVEAIRQGVAVAEHAFKNLDHYK